MDALAPMDGDQPMSFLLDGDEWAIRRVLVSVTKGKSLPDDNTMTIDQVIRALGNLKPETTVRLSINEVDWEITGIHTGQRLAITASQTNGVSE